jgi:hypothetical protein
MQITRNERRLLGVLAVIVFGMGNYFGYSWLAKRQASLHSESLQLEADQAEAKIDLQQADAWGKVQGWIRTHEPVAGDEGGDKAQVLEYVLKGARDNKLEILEQSLNDAQHGAAGTCITITVQVKGSMEGLVKWLAGLQKPEQFYAISSFSLKADQDQKSMVCTLQVARYFKDKEGA